MTTPRPPVRFAPTRWTRVLAARERDAEGQRALSDLCGFYYEPVLAFVRQTTRDSGLARDLTHDFFAKLLEKPSLDGAEQGRGRFRSYLLGAVKHFLRDEWQKRQAQRRGAGQEPVELEEAALTAHDESPSADALFDREWAIALVNRALDALEDECEEDGKGDLYEALKPWLTGNIAASQAEAAVSLGITEGAVKVAIHRLRKRYREIVSSELSHTLLSPTEEKAEMQHLIQALAAGQR